MGGRWHAWSRDASTTYAAWWSHPNDKFDPARDVRLAELDGRGRRRSPSRTGSTPPMGCASTAAAGRSTRHFAGAGSAACCSPTGSPRSASARRDATGTSIGRACSACGSTTATSAGSALAERFGYEPARWFFDMERSIEGDLPAHRAAARRPRAAADVRRPGVASCGRPTTRRSATTGAATTTRRRTSGAGVESPEFDPAHVPRRLGRRRDRRWGPERHLSRGERGTRHSGAAGWTACSRAAPGAAAGWPATSSCARSTSFGSGE